MRPLAGCQALADHPRANQQWGSRLGQIILMAAQGTSAVAPHSGHKAATLHAHQKQGQASGRRESRRMFPEAMPVGEPAWSWVEGCLTWCFLAKRRLWEEKGEGLGEGASLGPSSREDRGLPVALDWGLEGEGRREGQKSIHRTSITIWFGKGLSQAQACERQQGGSGARQPLVIPSVLRMQSHKESPFVNSRDRKKKTDIKNKITNKAERGSTGSG